MRNPYSRVAVVGAYNTVQAKQLPNWTESALVLDAVRGAISDAGLSPADVDGVNVSRLSIVLRNGSHVMRADSRPWRAS